MADNIINLADRRKQTAEPKQTWAFDMSVFDTDYGVPEAVIDFGVNADVERGGHLRTVADRLDVLSFLMRQEAELYSSSDDGVCLAQAHIFESSKVRVRVDDAKVREPEHFVWLAERWLDAEANARRALKGEQAT